MKTKPYPQWQRRPGKPLIDLETDADEYQRIQEKRRKVRAKVKSRYSVAERNRTHAS